MEGLTLLVVAEGLGVATELNLALRRYASVTVLGPAFDVRAAREALADGSIDVVVIDVDRNDEQGLVMIGDLRATTPVPVVATCSRVDPDVTALVLAAGGSGIVSRDEEPRVLVRLLRSAAEGQLALPDGHLSSVVEHLHTARAARQREALATLTVREREVLLLLCEGRSVGEIASALEVSVSTIQAHVKGVFAKLGVHSQVEAVRVAWRSGIGVPATA
jgi:DNA-binding NarL/FixJ family response regulator